jgi:serine/threonine-protein kinase RsbW
MSDAGITCEGRLESLAPLLAYVGRVSDDAGLRSEDAFAVRLAVEEVCTNVITHGYGDRAQGPLSVRARRDPQAFVVTIEDRAPTFDPADAPAADLASDWQTRPLGGVGWHLVRELMDDVRYEPVPGGNRVTLIRNLPGDGGSA